MKQTTIEVVLILRTPQKAPRKTKIKIDETLLLNGLIKLVTA